MFHKVLPGAIEKLLDEKNQPLSKRADLGKHLGIRNIRGNFKEFSLHHDHPTGRDNQMQALEFANDEHQQEILRLNEEINELIANRHVARRECFDNVLCFIKKNSKEGHPYYVTRCQYRQLEKHKRWLKLRYPNMEVADECDDPNAIHRWNRFKREVIKVNCPGGKYLRPNIL